MKFENITISSRTKNSQTNMRTNDFKHQTGTSRRRMMTRSYCVLQTHFFKVKIPKSFFNDFSNVWDPHPCRTIFGRSSRNQWIFSYRHLLCVIRLLENDVDVRTQKKRRKNFAFEAIYRNLKRISSTKTTTTISRSNVWIF